MRELGKKITMAVMYLKLLRINALTFGWTQFAICVFK